MNVNIEKAEFIDFNGNKHNIDKINEIESFRNKLSYFQVGVKPLINDINNSESILIIDEREKDNMFTLINVSDELKEKLKIANVLINFN